MATVLSAFLFIPNIAFMAFDTGLDRTAEQAGFDTKTNPNDRLNSLISSAISTILGLMGVLLLVMFIWGGYEWMSAGGDSKKVTNAKDRIRNATIGLAIVLGAYALSSFVFDSLVNSVSP